MKTLFKGFRKYSRWMRNRKRILQLKAIESHIREARLKYYQSYNDPKDDISSFRVLNIHKYNFTVPYEPKGVAR